MTNSPFFHHPAAPYNVRLRLGSGVRLPNRGEFRLRANFRLPSRICRNNQAP